MFRTEADHTVTLRRPDPETGEVVAVEVTVKRGKHTKGKSPDFDAALEHLFAAHLAHDEDRPDPVQVTDLATGELVTVDALTTDTAPEG